MLSDVTAQMDEAFGSDDDLPTPPAADARARPAGRGAFRATPRLVLAAGFVALSILGWLLVMETGDRLVDAGRPDTPTTTIRARPRRSPGPTIRLTPADTTTTTEGPVY